MRILIAGILGGIVMFIWTSIAHMALPLGEAGINEIPNESAVLARCRAASAIELVGFVLVEVVAALMLQRRSPAV